MIMTPNNIWTVVKAVVLLMTLKVEMVQQDKDMMVVMVIITLLTQAPAVVVLVKLVEMVQVLVVVTVAKELQVTLQVHL